MMDYFWLTIMPVSDLIHFPMTAYKQNLRRPNFNMEVTYLQVMIKGLGLRYFKFKDPPCIVYIYINNGKDFVGKAMLCFEILIADMIEEEVLRLESSSFYLNRTP